MSGAQEVLDLWDYRRRVAEIYQAVRNGPPGEATWLRWSAARDELFARHPQSPFTAEARASFTGLPYFPYQPSYRVEAVVEPAQEGEAFGLARFALDGHDLHLSLFWLEGYGGGVFVAFRDATSGLDSYGGGRYLLDTAKGADLGHAEDRVVLDFNYAYHPSCAHDPRWSCPLAPPENRLPVPLRAGERLLSP